MRLNRTTAARWVERWERQQQRYAIDREERFTVIGDVVEHVTAGRSRPLLVDLGCGPGSLAVRLAARLPAARVVAVDMDPVLLELGRTTLGGRRGPGAVRYVDAVIGEDGWTDALGLDGPLDAAVSTTALHYLPDAALQRVYAQLRAILRPGGVLVNADHLHQDGPSEISAHVGRRRAARVQAHGSHATPELDDWDGWWAAAARDPELTHLFAERRRRGAGGGTNGLSLGRHAQMLRAAGFAQVGCVWQVGDSCVLVAVR